MKALGLKDEDELQSYFIRRMDAFLTGRGRRLIGWDEILEGGLAPDATVMSWRGEEGGIAAAQAGHDVVMAPNQLHLLRLLPGRRSGRRSRWPSAATCRWRRSTAYEPIPPALTPEEGQHVLGAQGQLWTEYMPDAARSSTWPSRGLSALAEVRLDARRAQGLRRFLRRAWPPTSSGWTSST